VVFVHGFLVDHTLWADVPDRLAAAGHRTYAPTWPLGAHTTPMAAGADLSPVGIARVVLAFLEALDLDDVILVGSDTGGGVSQLVVDTDPGRIGRLVLTNCDAFDVFPPAPFDTLFRVARHPRAGQVLLQSMRPGFLRNSKLGFGWLVRRDLTAAETRPWVEPYLGDPGVRRDVAAFCRGWDRRGLEQVSARMATFGKPVLLCWAPADPFFRYALAKRLLATFPDATLVEFRDALAFVSLDQPAELAEAILGWLS
jgi:pimeloyl-ACP methyl ester carboxylesterase